MASSLVPVRAQDKGSMVEEAGLVVVWSSPQERAPWAGRGEPPWCARGARARYERDRSAYQEMR